MVCTAGRQTGDFERPQMLWNWFSSDPRSKLLLLRTELLLHYEHETSWFLVLNCKLKPEKEQTRERDIPSWPIVKKVVCLMLSTHREMPQNSAIYLPLTSCRSNLHSVMFSHTWCSKQLKENCTHFAQCSRLKISKTRSTSQHD